MNRTSGSTIENFESRNPMACRNCGFAFIKERLTRFFVWFLVSSLATGVAQAATIQPDSSFITYSDYANVTISPTAAVFARPLLSGSPFSNDNPGARVRFRTDATDATATLNYNGLHTDLNQNSTGVVLVDGVISSTFTFSSRPGTVSVPLVTLGPAAFRTIEIVMPYADSVDFQGLTVNAGAAFQAISPRPPIRYVAYGDSITQGFNGSDATKNYSWQIGTSKNWSVINMGFGYREATASDGTSIAGLGGDIFSVLLGVNDAIGGKTAAQFQADYTSLIANIRLLQPDVPIYAITPLFTTAPYGGDALIPQYRTAISNLVQNGNDPNLHLIDGLSLIPGIDGSNYTTWMPDGIHPNDAGFQLIAQNLAPQLNVVPEPDTSVLLGLGCAALLALRKRAPSH